MTPPPTTDASQPGSGKTSRRLVDRIVLVLIAVLLGVLSFVWATIAGFTLPGPWLDRVARAAPLLLGSAAAGMGAASVLRAAVGRQPASVWLLLGLIPALTRLAAL